MKLWTMAFCSLAFAFASGCTTDGTGIIQDNSPDDINGDEDQDAPLITHTPVDGSQPIGEDVFITCSAVDVGSGVAFVSVFFKQETSSEWDDVLLTVVDEAGTYEGYIPGEDVESAGMDYFIAAEDRSENVGYYPDAGEDDPFHFRISAN